jgi:hypothetical protein
MAKYFWTSTSSTDPTVGANWTKDDGTTGTAPTSGDDAVVQGVPGSVLAVINAADMHTVTLNSLTVNIPTGGPTIGTAGNGGYWRISATTSKVTGGGRIKIDFGSVQTNCTANANGASADAGQEAIRFIGTHASNIFSVTGGPVGIATNQPYELSTAAPINVSNNGTCNTGASVAVGSVNTVSGGTYNGNSALSGTLTIGKGSSASSNGSGTIAAVMNLGTWTENGTGTVTAVDNYGTADVSGSSGVTWTTGRIYPGSKILTNPANPAALAITTRTLKNTASETYA